MSAVFKLIHTPGGQLIALINLTTSFSIGVD
jgi:hypothetical protein